MAELRKDTIVVSTKKAEEFLQRVNDCFNQMHTRLQGELLTTLEVGLAGQQLEAFKSRVKAIQGQIWDRMEELRYDRFEAHFSTVEDTGNLEEKPSIEKYHQKVQEFWHQLERVIEVQLDYFQSRVKDLAALALEKEKRTALETEMVGLISGTSNTLGKWIKRAVDEVLLQAIKVPSQIRE